MSYVDGYILPVPRKNLAAYRRMAQFGARLWKRHGALEYRECVGDDLKAAPWALAYPKGLKLKAGETVIFAWVVFKSKAHRNRVNAAVMKDPVLAKSMPKKMPFDVKRMCYGGFKVLVDSKRG